MIPIAALTVSPQSPVVLKNKPYEQKTDSAPSNATMKFADLLGSLTAEGKMASDEVINSEITTDEVINNEVINSEIASEEVTNNEIAIDETVSATVVSGQLSSEYPQGELLEKLEDVLEVLQALPQETMSPEQQDVINSIIQMLSLQASQMESQLQVTESSIENTMVNNPVPEKLMNLLHEVDQKLKELFSLVSSKQFEDVPTIVGVEEKKVLADPEKFEQVVKQLVGFIQQLEKQQQITGKQPSLQQVEQLEQVTKQMTNLTEEIESRLVVTETNKRNVATLETLQQVSVKPVPQQQEVNGVKLEPIQLEENSQPLTTFSTTETPKSTLASARTEPTLPTPTVRMSNLIEELGEVLRGSFRLNANGEGTQIKVNIFPEHLGHLDIRITELNGKIAAQIFTSSLVAKEALDLQVNQLRNALLQQGITIEKIDITQQHSSQSFEHQQAHSDQRFSQQQKHGTASGNKNGYQRMEEEATAIERHHAENGMMKVDYTI
ncbi:flagellar hook-length control protein FliK [Paenisporosarcina sp.]|uniref:flagellar hook-length control protein FliK n=1 Tax=Paenisporosarcina sp. TaxID=1932001 RepID=UPI003C718084